jgi:hypothetical protein
LFHFIFLFVGTDQETLLWTNAGVLVLTLYLLKQDREILLTYHQNKKISNEDNSSSSLSQEIKIQSPVLDSSPSSSSTFSSGEDWIQAFNGQWKIIRQENAVESWYPMAGINFLIRPIALTVLMTLIKKITITSDDILEIERSFNGKKYWKANIKIAKNKETAEVLETEVDGVKSSFCCWIDENEKALYLEFEPFDQQKGIWVKHKREILPNGELKMVSHDFLVFLSLSLSHSLSKCLSVCLFCLVFVVLGRSESGHWNERSHDNLFFKVRVMNGKVHLFGDHERMVTVGYYSQSVPDES